MLNINKKRKRKGLTLVEMLMVSFLSIFILMMIYQVTSGAVNLFLSTKSNSDSLETKVPAMEIIGRYFERRGVAVVNPSADSIALNLKADPKYIGEETNTFIGADAGEKITFYSNLGGFAIVRTTTSLTSCRLNEELPDQNPNGKKCYYIYRGTGGSQTPSTLDGGTTPNNKVDAITFPTSFSNLIETSKCVDENFVLSNPNITGISSTLAGTIEDSAGAVSGASAITLEVGDYIFRSPHIVELFVRNNPSDDNRRWLYSRLTTVASACSNNYSNEDDKKQFLDQPLAPAEKITLDSFNANSATITVVFRTDFKGKNKSKYFSVTRTFGG